MDDDASDADEAVELVPFVATVDESRIWFPDGADTVSQRGC